MKTLALVMLVALTGLADAAGPDELEAVARNLVYCSTVADAFSRNKQMREYRDLFLGSAAALTSRQFVASERGAALTKVEAKIAEAKQATEGGGSAQSQLGAFTEDLKGCLAQLRTHQDEIAAGLRKLNEKRP